MSLQELNCYDSLFILPDKKTFSEFSEGAHMTLPVEEDIGLAPDSSSGTFANSILNKGLLADLTYFTGAKHLYEYITYWIAKALGIKAPAVTVTRDEGYVYSEEFSRLSPLKHAIIKLSSPIANILIGSLFSISTYKLMASAYSPEIAVIVSILALTLSIFGLANLIIGIYNLVPMKKVINGQIRTSRMYDVLHFGPVSSLAANFAFDILSQLPPALPTKKSQTLFTLSRLEFLKLSILTGLSVILSNIFCSKKTPTGPTEVDDIRSIEEAAERGGEWLLTKQTRDPSGLIVTYGSVDSHPSTGICWSFDQGCTMTVFAKKNPNAVTIIANKILELQEEDGLWRDGYYRAADYFGEDNNYKRHKSVGPNVVVGRGLLELYESTNRTEKRYLEASIKLADSLAEKFLILDKETPDEIAFFEKGLDLHGQKIHSVSTEENARAGIFFYRLYQITGEEKYLEVTRKIANWLKDRMWAGDHFEIGYNEDHTPNHDTKEGSDAQIMPIIFFGMVNKDPKIGGNYDPNVFYTVPWLDAHFRNTIRVAGKIVTGYGKVQGIRHIWPEVTANLAAAYKVWGMLEKWDETLQELVKIFYKNGSLPHIVGDEGIGYGWPDHYPHPSVSATASFVAAAQLEPYSFPKASTRRDFIAMIIGSGIGKKISKTQDELSESDLTQEPRVAILILHYGQADGRGERNTFELLKSLEDLNYSNYEIILLDNNSPDNFFDKYKDNLVERFPRLPKITFIKSDVNLGFAEGNNIGMEHASANGADYFFLLNNDTVVDKDSLTHSIRVAEGNPDVGLVGPKILRYEERDVIDYAGGRFFRRPFGCNEIDRGQYDDQREVDYAGGAAILVRKKVFDEVGGMAREIFMYFDEIEWAMKVKKAGYRVIYAPESKVWHKMYGGAERRFAKETIYFWTRNGIYIIRHHPEYLIQQTIRVILAMLSSVKGTIFKDKEAFFNIFKGLYDGFAGRFSKVERGKLDIVVFNDDVPESIAVSDTEEHDIRLTETIERQVEFVDRPLGKSKLEKKSVRAVLRVFDITLSAVLILFLSLPMLIISISIKLEDPKASIFFKQRRLGIDGKPFTMWKMRTLKSGLAGDLFVKEDDVRISRIGRLLRSSGLDEYPQLFQILLGQMSFVGYGRPLPWCEVVANHNRLIELSKKWKPGLIEYFIAFGNREDVGRQDFAIDIRTQMNSYFVENWSFGLHFRTLLYALLRGAVKSAYLYAVERLYGINTKPTNKLASQDRRIKILYIISRLDWSGGALILSDIIKGLDKKRFDISLITGQKESINSVAKERLEDSGVEIQYIPNLIRDISPIRDIGVLVSLHLAIKKIKPDIVYTHLSKAGFVGRVAAKLAGVRGIIHTPHILVYYKYFGTLTTKLYVFLIRILNRISDKLVVLSEIELQDRYRRRLVKSEKEISVNLGIDVNRFNKLPKSRILEYKNELDIPPNYKVICTVGRLDQRKGFKYLSSRGVFHGSPNTADLIFHVDFRSLYACNWCIWIAKPMAANSHRLLSSFRIQQRSRSNISLTRPCIGSTV
jgi:GT2 family glycosyltransferase/lipopolysaccharide/colanic/teichoic acid biosynthesis glycosyltransferase